MKYFRSYNLPPTQPFSQPISSHPPTAPCSPGAQLAEGQYVSRGGVFEGAAMASGESHCGYWSDYIGEVPLWQQGYPPSHPSAAPYEVREVRAWPPELPARFQPREINLGYPLSPAEDRLQYEAATLRGLGQMPQGRSVLSRIFAKLFGTRPVGGFGAVTRLQRRLPTPGMRIPPGYTVPLPPCSQGGGPRITGGPAATVTQCGPAGCTSPYCRCDPRCSVKDVYGTEGQGLIGTVCECPPLSGFGQGTEPVNPYSQLTNRQLNIWTAPLYANQGQGPQGYTPRGGVLDGNTVQYRGQGVASAYYYGESPKVLQPVDMVGILPNPVEEEPVPVVGWGISGMGDYAAGRNGGVEEAQLPKPICPRVATSIFQGAVPGGKVLARSIFETSVYETRGGDVPTKLTINPAVTAAPAFSPASAMQLPCSGFGGCGAGPDGLGAFPRMRIARRRRMRIR